MIILSGDIGGTNTRIQLAEFGETNEIEVIKFANYNSKNYQNFLEIIDVFFADVKVITNEISAACFGIAGPVVAENVFVTNLPWVVRVSDVKSKLKIDSVYLINDFVSIGYGIDVLKPHDLEIIQFGSQQNSGIKAYIGAGTGLGIGFISYFSGDYVVHSTEGGHIDFAPTDEIQVELLRYLKKKYHRVSLERVLSGPGLENIYCFVRDNKFFDEKENLLLQSLIDHQHNAATISEYAIMHKDILAIRSLEIFMSIYGAAVGNLALTFLPFNGLYIVGGIVRKLVSQFKEKVFFDAFYDKGRMSGLIKNIPIHAVLYDGVGLQGAAMYARKMFLGNAC